MSYGVLTLPLASAGADFRESQVTFREMLAKGFNPGTSGKHKGCSDQMSHHSSRSGTEASINVWLRRMIEMADPDLLYRQSRTELSGLNRYEGNNVPGEKLYSDALNVCLVRSYLGVGKYPMLNLLLLGDFPSFFPRNPHEDSGNALLSYLTIAGETACACAVLQDGVLGRIPTNSDTYIVFT
jgi:hypothetical protein